VTPTWSSEEEPFLSPEWWWRNGWREGVLVLCLAVLFAITLVVTTPRQVRRWWRTR